MHRERQGHLIEWPESMRTYLRVVDLYVDTGRSVLQDRRSVRGAVAVQFTAKVLPVKIHRAAPPSVSPAFPHTHLLPHLPQCPKCKTRQVLAMKLRGGAEQEQTHGTKEHFRKHFHSVTFFLYCPFGINFFGVRSGLCGACAQSLCYPPAPAGLLATGRNDEETVSCILDLK